MKNTKPVLKINGTRVIVGIDKKFLAVNEILYEIAVFFRSSQIEADILQQIDQLNIIKKSIGEDYRIVIE